MAGASSVIYAGLEEERSGDYENFSHELTRNCSNKCLRDAGYKIHDAS